LKGWPERGIRGIYDFYKELHNRAFRTLKSVDGGWNQKLYEVQRALEEAPINLPLEVEDALVAPVSALAQVTGLDENLVYPTSYAWSPVAHIAEGNAANVIAPGPRNKRIGRSQADVANMLKNIFEADPSNSNFSSELDSFIENNVSWGPDGGADLDKLIKALELADKAQTYVEFWYKLAEQPVDGDTYLSNLDRLRTEADTINKAFALKLKDYSTDRGLNSPGDYFNFWFYDQLSDAVLHYALNASVTDNVSDDPGLEIVARDWFQDSVKATWESVLALPEGSQPLGKNLEVFYNIVDLAMERLSEAFPTMPVWRLYSLLSFTFEQENDVSADAATKGAYDSLAQRIIIYDLEAEGNADATGYGLNDLLATSAHEFGHFLHSILVALSRRGNVNARQVLTPLTKLFP
jgi:hypothetical protein